jgi:chromosome segregation protein
MKRRIEQLRNELRTLASVNPGAINEYHELLERYTFLTTQADDLRRGADSLRQVIVELHKTMKRLFEETFKAVAAEFQVYFRTLFGGGTARLTLTDPRDFTQTGIEIAAQPPGKRLQNLALLSGGERALTGVALLFAILKVNPTPICVLDEVDAALDESNIGRFCGALRVLSERTQFIIITHNRGTMEIANTLYGVTLVEGGASRVISLRLSDIEMLTNRTNSSSGANGAHSPVPLAASK